jgi:hypothetical protein
MSRKTTFAVAALLSFAVAGAAMAQGTKTDTTKKAPTKSTMKKADAKTTKTDTTKKAATKGTMKKGGTMKKDTTTKKP